ncbi:MAG TPA: CDP-alcohol phosphatidyltransferase family protein [Mycobacteriales bacterium]|jgi:CDP-diacylglycerol--glycerol-3-phosphate 3-phosphatidyltransferase|nr:CDP-alcohol phosphatidyltransferase family protein [Mycobacteriales bacterium]
MFNALRPGINRVARPLATTLLRWGVTPDAVTLAGTVGVAVGSLAFLSRGMFLIGTIVAVLSVLTDMLDGAMARERGGTSRFGAWLDSTCDRVADAAVFCSLAWWFDGDGDSRLLAAVSMYCLVSGVVVSYAKARAEGLGMQCNVGIAERSERLVLAFGGTAIVGLGGPDVALPILLWVLAVVTTITVAQRAVEVRRQAGPLT